jgi:YVTN family beta-propeller protein
MKKIKKKNVFLALLGGFILLIVAFVSFKIFFQTTSGEDFAYVVNQGSDTISVISISTNTVIKTIPVGHYPWRVAFTPDGRKAYVTHLGSDSVSIIDTSTHTVVKTIPVGICPKGLDVSPDGRLLYVGNNAAYKDLFDKNTVSVIDTYTDTVVSTIPWGDRYGPNGVAFTPDGSKVWISGVSSGVYVNCIQVLTVPDNTAFATIHDIISGSDWIEFLPDGSFAFVVSSCGCCGNLQKVSTASNSVVWTYYFGGGGDSLAIAPDGSAVYAGSSRHCTGISLVYKFNPVTTDIINSMSIPGDPGYPNPNRHSPTGLCVTPDGKFLYVAIYISSAAGQVLVADTSNMTVTKAIDVGLWPRDIKIFHLKFPPKTGQEVKVH